MKEPAMRIVPFCIFSSLLLSACATQTAQPAATYKAADFKPAIQKHKPAPPKQTVIAESLPLPSPDPSPKPDARPPKARVRDANHEALHEPTSDGYINAVQIYPFSENALYRLYAAPQEVTDIVLEPGETLSAISAGDTVRWAVGDTISGNGQGRQVHVLVKPFAPNLKTNLVILTDRRTYHLEMESTPHTSMAAISWSYPAESLIIQNNDPTGPATVDRGIAIDHLNFRYAITGNHPAWRPIRAFDDGSKVYIQFPKNFNESDAPPLFVVGQDGNSDLVNYRVSGDYYVVDRLFAAAELRLGKDDQQIVRITRTDGRAAGG
jgi:P-type conjugative transfer protein TrbG